MGRCHGCVVFVDGNFGHRLRQPGNKLQARPTHVPPLLGRVRNIHLCNANSTLHPHQHPLTRKITVLLRLQRRLQHVHRPHKTLPPLPIPPRLRKRHDPKDMHRTDRNHINMGLHILFHGMVPLLPRARLLGLESHRRKVLRLRYIYPLFASGSNPC